MRERPGTTGPVSPQDGTGIPAREPAHATDRHQARGERRLAVGGFAILIGFAVLWASIRYGTVAAAVGATVIIGGGLIVAALWLLLAALEWWARQPPPDDGP